MSLFNHPRRVVTGHDDNGKAIVVSDSEIPSLPMPINCNFAVLYETFEFPCSNDEWKDPILERTQSLSNQSGVVLRVVDFKPNTETVLCSSGRLIRNGLTVNATDISPYGISGLWHCPFGRNGVVSYSAVLDQPYNQKQGNWLKAHSVLDGGVEVTVKAGDVCVQRGTIHGWHNRTDKPARVFFVLTAAKPVKIGDKMLGATGFHHEDVASGGETS